MKANLFSSIKTKIFLSYGSIILLLTLFTSFLYYFVSYNTFVKNYTATSRQSTKIISHQIEQTFDNINVLQKKMLESDVVREYVFENAARRKLAFDRAFQNTIYTICGYDFEFFHMNILNLEDNHLITFGQRYDYQPYELTSSIKQDLIQPTINLNGAKNIMPTDSGTIYKIDKDVHTISMLRCFGRYALTIPKAVIEIQINYNTLDRVISDTIYSFNRHAETVLIFDKNKKLIYPYDLDQKLLNHYISLDFKNETSFINPNTKEREIVTTHTSDFTGFTTLLITPDSYILTNQHFYRNIGILIAAVSLLLLTTISYRVAQSITRPIIRLKDSISHLELDSISEESAYVPGSNLNELELLSDAYNRMQVRLKESLDDIVKSKTLSVHAQIMALQAQMDSHFLYNSLTIISIMAEEHDDMQVADMCIKLTQMLRYITEDYSKNTTFEQELKHTRNYTDLMSIRFGDKISFDYHIEPGLCFLPIPRLIIQPLVENSVKYSREDGKTLQIEIHSWLEENYWYTEIRDNGNGFTDEAINQVNQKIESLNKEENYPELTINGMGIANIYLRLKLFYSNLFVFEIKNTDQGAFIKIGGNLNEYECDNNRNCNGR